MLTMHWTVNVNGKLQSTWLQTTNHPVHEPKVKMTVLGCGSRSRTASSGPRRRDVDAAGYRSSMRRAA